MQGSLARSLARVPCIQGGKDKGKKQKGQEAIDLVSGAFFFSFFLAEGPDIWPWPWRSMPGDWRATSERSK